MSLTKFNYDFLIQPFGLHNSGSLCYLNSLIQSVLSSPSFVQLLYSHEDEFQHAGDNLGTRLLTVCKQFDCGPDFLNTTDSSPFRQSQIADVSGVLREIQRIRTSSGMGGTLHTHTQEDVFEGFKFLIESLDSTDSIDGEVFLSNFAVRHRLTIHCGACNKQHNADKSSAPSEIMVNMADRDPLLQKNLESQEMVEKYIKTHMLYPDDYRCEDCNVKNNQALGELYVKQFYSLARISSVIVLSFHHNHSVLLENAFARPGTPKKERTVAWFPQELTFLDVGKKLLKYKIIAQIEQYGSLSSGHYIAKCLRPRPPGHSQNRLQNAKKALQDTVMRIQIAEKSQDRSRIEHLQNRATKMAGIIKDEERRLSSNDPWDKMGVFRFDDRAITYESNGFTPNENTYLVFYQLV